MKPAAHQAVQQGLQHEAVRLDKWLWAARFFKTRTLATEAVDRGRVRLNGALTKPAHNVKVGDMLAIDNGTVNRDVLVCGLAQVRGSAAIAQGLYEETAASQSKREAVSESRRFFSEPGAAIKGRPTKRDRRLIDKSSR
jgi:ribosome-associated heat shock protein Hsp15